MKKFIIVLLATLSVQAFAEPSLYTGSNQGAACTVRLDLTSGQVQMGDIGIFARKKSQDGNTLVLEGGADFEDARITLILDPSNEPTSAKLETRNMILPFYRTKLICTNLIRTK